MLNPVFRREVRTVLRTWKTFIAISIYVLSLTGVTALVLLSMLGNIMYNGFNPQSSTTMYTVMSMFQLGLISLIVPALTGGAISGERERQTFDLMLVTKMSSFSIVAGKLVSSLLVVLLMIVASLPVFGVILYYGGVSLVNLLTMALFFLVTSAMVGSIAIFFSALFKRTVIAIVATYLVLIVLSLATLFILLVSGELASAYLHLTKPPMAGIYSLLSVNPFTGFMSVIDSQLGSNNINNLIESMAYRYYNPFTPVSNTPTVPLPLWGLNVIFDGVLIVLLTGFASLIIRPAKKSKMYK